jgi:hypothetical protein
VGRRFLKKSTVLRLLLLVDRWGHGTARRGTPTSALRRSANFACTEFSEVRNSKQRSSNNKNHSFGGCNTHLRHATVAQERLGTESPLQGIQGLVYDPHKGPDLRLLLSPLQPVESGPFSCPYSPKCLEAEFSEVCGGRNLHEVMGARAPLRGKNSRTGRSRPVSESTMNTTWWMCSLPGGNPPTRCAVQKSG